MGSSQSRDYVDGVGHDSRHQNWLQTFRKHNEEQMIISSDHKGVRQVTYVVKVYAQVSHIHGHLILVVVIKRKPAAGTTRRARVVGIDYQ